MSDYGRAGSTPVVGTAIKRKLLIFNNLRFFIFQSCGNLLNIRYGKKFVISFVYFHKLKIKKSKIPQSLKTSLSLHSIQIFMKKIIPLLLVVIGVSACKKAVYNRNCCAETGTFVIFEGGYLTIPNAFTPNGDGVDDSLTPITLGVNSYTLTVKLEDETVFVGENEGWNGRIDGSIQSGIYGYIIDIETSDGERINKLGQACSIPDPADACLDEADNCRFESQFVPGSTIDEVGVYDPENRPGPVFCDE